MDRIGRRSSTYWISPRASSRRFAIRFAPRGRVVAAMSSPGCSSPYTLRSWLAAGPYTLVMSSSFFGSPYHAGLLAALLEAGLPPSEVAGSSSGALVARYATQGSNLKQVCYSHVWASPWTQPARRRAEHGGVPRRAAGVCAERRAAARAAMGGAGRPLQPEVRRPTTAFRDLGRASLHPCPSISL